MASGSFSASIAGFAEQVEGQTKRYLDEVTRRTLSFIINASAIETSWLRNHWRASLTGAEPPLERMPKGAVPMRPQGDDSLAACAPVFAAFQPGQKLTITNTAASAEGYYYPILTEYGGPRNPAHYTLTRTVAELDRIAKEAAAAVRGR
jgi:hypothetical protein